MEKILFFIFALPVLMVKDAWARITKNMTKEEKEKMLWKIPYVLLGILVFILIVLLAQGY